MLLPLRQCTRWQSDGAVEPRGAASVSPPSAGGGTAAHGARCFAPQQEGFLGGCAVPDDNSVLCHAAVDRSTALELCVRVGAACGGVTQNAQGAFEARAGTELRHANKYTGEVSWLKVASSAECVRAKE